MSGARKQSLTIRHEEKKKVLESSSCSDSDDSDVSISSISKKKKCKKICLQASFHGKPIMPVLAYDTWGKIYASQFTAFAPSSSGLKWLNTASNGAVVATYGQPNWSNYYNCYQPVPKKKHRELLCPEYVLVTVAITIPAIKDLLIWEGNSYIANSNGLYPGQEVSLGLSTSDGIEPSHAVVGTIPESLTNVSKDVNIGSGILNLTLTAILPIGDGCMINTYVRFSEIPKDIWGAPVIAAPNKTLPTGVTDVVSVLHFEAIGLQCKPDYVSQPGSCNTCPPQNTQPTYYTQSPFLR